MTTVTYHLGHFDIDRTALRVAAAAIVLLLVIGTLAATRSTFASDNVTPQTNYLEIETSRDPVPPGLSFNNVP